jgi:predicted kinase
MTLLSEFWKDGLSMSFGTYLYFVIWLELSTDALSQRQKNFKRYFVKNVFSKSLNASNDSYAKVKQKQRRQQNPPKSTPT